MRIFKFWQVESERFEIDGNPILIKCYGGSNVSDEDARAQAREKIAKVKRRINGDRRVFETYETEIREEVVSFLNEEAVITRNRYGAQVLNLQNIMVLDIDKPKTSFFDLFRKRDDSSDKQKIIEMVRKLAQKPAYRELGLRIYETSKGIRVIVVGKTFNPASSATNEMMKEFNSDNLYRFLCQKQKCFRARLTPKPSRIKIRAYRVKFPRSAEEEAPFREWLAGYEHASQGFSTCRFVEQIGPGLLPDVIRLHDEISGAYRDLRLA